MESLTVRELANACRIFLERAYPDGPETIPESKRPYSDLDIELSPDAYVRPTEVAVVIGPDLARTKGSGPGFEFRLGSATYPHLKLRVQLVDFRDEEVWVFSVDTHDHFQRAARHLGSQEAEAWRKLVEQNRLLKHDIEEALAQASFLTPNNLLRLGLPAPA